MVKNRVDLWAMVNANSFTKVNAFGKTIHFYFKDEGKSYTTSLGKVHYRPEFDEVMLEVKVQE